MRRAACLLLLMISAFCLSAQRATPDNTRQPRILLLVDASSSMIQPWDNGTTRFETASRIVTALMDSIYTVNAGVEFGLRVYGHQSPSQNNDCLDSKQEVMFSKNNVTQMGLRLASIRPYGVSPIAYSLKEAALNDLEDEVRNAYSIILITDGGESCGGDICEVVKTLIDKKIFFKPYILSLVDYAPLKDQYACLGNYLQVSKPGEIPLAINKIVDAYRPLLSMPIMAVKKDTTPTPKPPVQNVQVVIPKWIPSHEDFGTLSITIPKTELPVRDIHPAVHPVAGLQRIVAPKLAVKDTIPSIAGTPTVTKLVVKPPAIITQTVATPTIVKPVVVMRKDMISAIDAVQSGRVSVRPTAKPVMTSAAKPVAIHVDKPRDTIVAVAPTVKPPDTATRTTIKIVRIIDTVAKRPIKPLVPKPVVNNKPKEMAFTQETEESKETTLSIAFTDGHGKFYATTPQLQLLDAATGKSVKQFYRTVDANGNPDPQTVPAGTYNLLIAGRSNMLMRRVQVLPSKNNKLIVRVSNGSLRFRYEDAPDRPITEFDAIVNIRFEPGPTMKQHCTAEWEYPPGNYYIEINTQPISRFNVDIDFGAITEIQIPQCGFVQFTNNTPKGTVALYYPLGNKFVQFYSMNISGTPVSQKMRLKPGQYEAHWLKNPAMPQSMETVEKFVVQSNSITEVELR